MCSATADAAASSARWPDLPSDLLRDISRRLHVATDYVRFHAVCNSWRDTLPPQPCRPTFLPWLLARQDHTGHRKARCVFFSKSSRSADADRLYIMDLGWAVAADDGAAASCIFTATCPDDESNNCLADPLAGSATSIALPPLRWSDTMKSRLKLASGMVSVDGTAFLYGFGGFGNLQRTMFTAELYPGDPVWRVLNYCYFLTFNIDTRCMAYHDGKIVHCDEGRLTIVSTKVGGGSNHGRIDNKEAAGKEIQSSYLVESRGNLLWVFVHVNTTSDYYRDTMEHRPAGELCSLQEALTVSIYDIEYGRGGEPRWVKRDCRSFVDRILFLGRQGSFSVDAARFGVGGGGCTYFVDSFSWSGKSPVERLRVYKYSFIDDRSELVEELPAEWNDASCMWLTPKPAISSMEEIREKLKLSIQVDTTEHFFWKVTDAQSWWTGKPSVFGGR